MQLAVPQSEPHQALTRWILLSRGNFFETQHLLIKMVNGVDMLASYILIHMVVAGDSTCHARNSTPVV